MRSAHLLSDQAVDQLLERLGSKRFAQVGARARLHPALEVVVPPLCADDDDHGGWCGATGAEAAQELQPIHHRHVDVQDHDIRWPLTVDVVERFLSVLHE